jgi:hypothetical protein
LASPGADRFRGFSFTAVYCLQLVLASDKNLAHGLEVGLHLKGQGLVGSLTDEQFLLELTAE